MMGESSTQPPTATPAPRYLGVLFYCYIIIYYCWCCCETNHVFNLSIIHQHFTVYEFLSGWIFEVLRFEITVEINMIAPELE